MTATINSIKLYGKWGLGGCFFFFFFLVKEENNQNVGKMESREHICTQGHQTAPHQNIKEGNPAKQVQPYLSLSSTPFLDILSLLWKKVDEARTCKVRSYNNALRGNRQRKLRIRRHEKYCKGRSFKMSSRILQQPRAAARSSASLPNAGFLYTEITNRPQQNHAYNHA